MTHKTIFFCIFTFLLHFSFALLLFVQPFDKLILEINTQIPRFPFRRRRGNRISLRSSLKSSHLSRWGASRGFFQQVWPGHRTHSAGRRPGQLSVQVSERKTSRVAASAASSAFSLFYFLPPRLCWHMQLLKGSTDPPKGQSYTHSMHSFLPPELLSFLHFFSSDGRRTGCCCCFSLRKQKPLGEKREDRKTERKKERKRGEEEGRRRAEVKVNGSFFFFLTATSGRRDS